jgi:hypothetical protein
MQPTTQPKTQPKTQTLLVTNINNKVDVNGNVLEIAQANQVIQLKLRLTTERRARILGVIHCPTRTFHVERKRSRHLFRKFMAYGFNHYVLANAERFDHVILEDEYTKWRIPREYILANGQYLHFKNNGGFELQIFMPLEKLEGYEIPKI